MVFLKLFEFFYIIIETGAYFLFSVLNFFKRTGTIILSHTVFNFLKGPVHILYCILFLNFKGTCAYILSYSGTGTAVAAAAGEAPLPAARPVSSCCWSEYFSYRKVVNACKN